MSLVQSFTEASAVVQIAAFFLVWILAWLPIAIPIVIGLKWWPPQPLSIGQKLALVLSLYALAPPLLWMIAQLQAIPISAYGLAWNISAFTSLALGLGVGVVGVGLLFSLERSLGWVTWNPPSWPQLPSVLLPTLAIALIVSGVEELVFRGFLLNQLQQEGPLWLAAFGSSLIFALLHLVWEGKQVVPQLPGLWLMGMVLVLARWSDGGSLALPIGLHAGWIWAMASLDGVQAICYTDGSPAWMTGLAGQPLAGVLGLLLLLATGGALWGWGTV